MLLVAEPVPFDDQLPDLCWVAPLDIPLTMMRILILLFLSSYCCIAQTGPGGIGTLDGSSTLKIWLTADDLDGDGDTSDNPANGALVSSWVNKVGSGINYTQSGAQRPSYRTGAHNSVYFNAAGSTYYSMTATSTGSFRGGSIFLITKVLDYGGRSTSFFDDSAASLRLNQYDNTNRVGFTRYGVADYATNLATVYGADALYSWHKASTSASVDIRVNGGRQTISIVDANAAIPYQRMGRATNGSDEASGDYYEIIAFDSKLNTTRIYLMENYLSAKYGGIALQYDIYDQDNPANGDYDFDVAGIGRVASGNQHTDARGTGIVRMLNPTNLGNNEYLIWGHDNRAIASTEVADVPFGIDSRLARIWRVSESSNTGTSVDVGAVDIRFDLTALGAIATEDLRLLVDRNNNGVFSDDTPIDGATDLGGGVYQFTAVTALTDNRRFTVATAQRGLPIELLSFTATPRQGGTVQLYWETIKEANNEIFTVERSADGQAWKSIATLPGSNNSNTLLRYRAQDTQPLAGLSYYRLRQTDFDGAYTLSAIRQVYLGAAPTTTLQIFPNPATDRITVVVPEGEAGEFSIIGAAGQRVDHLVRRGEPDGGKLPLDIGALRRGLYTLVTPTATTTFYKH